MKTLDLVDEYYNGATNIVGDISMILYGSTVFGVNSSDLDLCFCSDKTIDKNKFQELKEYTRDFHIINKLRIDEEVPYDNKLIYTSDFIKDTLNNSPFEYKDGKYLIGKISKTKEYLNSLEMRKRLLLNILTVKHKIYGKNGDIIEKNTDAAWELILKTVISYCELDSFTKDDLVSCLYEDPFGYNSGEMYLGYKTNMIEKMEYINDTVENQLTRLTEEEKIEKNKQKIYLPNKHWIR